MKILKIKKYQIWNEKTKCFYLTHKLKNKFLVILYIHTKTVHKDGSEKYKYQKKSKICQLSRGEICVANFIPPPANGASQGKYWV